MGYAVSPILLPLSAFPRRANGFLDALEVATWTVATSNLTTNSLEGSR